MTDYNLMTEKDYTVLGFSESSYYTHGIDLKKGELMVGSGFLTYGKSWPKEIVVDDIKHTFQHIDAMPTCLLGEFFSVAIYKI